MPVIDDATAVRIVQLQADAWNAKDADAFAACYAANAEVRSLIDDRVITITGRDAIRENYGRRFRARPELRVIIEHRHCHDGIVTDLEYFPERDMRSTVLFRVRDGLIDRAWIHASRMLAPIE
jgi:hypothetical protein